MKSNKDKYIWIAVAVMWFSTALAVSVGIYFTHVWQCLFFMFIPTFMSVKSKSDDKKEDQNE